MSIPNISEFFLGCNTPQGFVGRLEQLTSPSKLDMLYLLKGGAGSGKSTIMKKIAQKAVELGEDIELIRCSSDFNSLDGVILPKRKTAVFDGTLPHAGVTDQQTIGCLSGRSMQHNPLLTPYHTLLCVLYR